MRNKQVVVSHKVLSLLGEDTDRVMDTLDGCVYRTEDRHYLHRTLGKLNEHLLRYVTRHPIKQKALQEMISEQQVAPLIALGFLEYATSPNKVFNLSLVVDEYGELLRVVVDGSEGKAVFEKDVIIPTLSLQDNVYRMIGLYHK